MFSYFKQECSGLVQGSGFSFVIWVLEFAGLGLFVYVGGRVLLFFLSGCRDSSFRVAIIRFIVA